jgi:Tol biopolymer transport system component
MKSRFSLAFVFAVASAAALFAQPAKHPLTLDDIQRMADVRDPQCSPDGKSIAYVVSRIDVKEDKSNSHIWTIGIDGQNDRQVTFSQDSESSPKWSPDGKYLSFTSSRPGPAKGSQVWLLDRNGGEAFQLTDVKGRLQSYEWAPDGKRLALIVEDARADSVPAEAGTPDSTKRPLPIVVDRFQFKQDEDGYLRARYKHLYLFDLASRRDTILTPGAHDDQLPAWSPDGASIAFVSKRGADPDRTDNWDVYVVVARPGAPARQLTTYEGSDGDPYFESRLAWSPDGKSIAYLQG